MRERIQPKMGKIDIDYNILHDAFFKYQTKPDLLGHGEIYFEGKENEVVYNKSKPGRYSSELAEALGIAENQAPPWIVNMQKHGPPPAYPSLKVPGVNIPIPDSIKSTGLFQDENGFTVYADCHGLNRSIYQQRNSKKKYWGELDEEEVEEEVQDEEDDDEEDNQGGAEGGQ
jgi:splicing factor 3B subunit 2